MEGVAVNWLFDGKINGVHDRLSSDKLGWPFLLYASLIRMPNNDIELIFYLFL